ncbi:unnamed protein product [Symbiodinium microadriaticum]|nr:unnamed protein product [Symbiodinium microadriaticum]CAE7655563.1 unnamed protein product [Symbiodinium sp. KB8]
MDNGSAALKRRQEIHNCFNLFAIPPLVLLTGWSLAKPSPAAHKALSWSVLCYTMLDTIYNLMVPECQPSRRRWASILLHHVTAAWLVCFPISYEGFAHLTAYCTAVELNTMCFAIYKAFKGPAARAAHLLTWVVLRLGWYPYLVYHFHQAVRGAGFAVGSYEYCQSVGSQVILCSLNFFWTVEVALGMMQAKQKQKDEHLHRS